MSEPRWWTEPVDPDDPATHDGPIADVDEPPEEDPTPPAPEVVDDGG